MGFCRYSPEQLPTLSQQALDRYQGLLGEEVEILYRFDLDLCPEEVNFNAWMHEWSDLFMPVIEEQYRRMDAAFVEEHGAGGVAI
jgi:hypothetical protein